MTREFPHQIQLLLQGKSLLEGKGYLITELYQPVMTVYWVSSDFTLIAAMTWLKGQPAMTLKAIPIGEAQAGVSKELAYWASFADKN